MATPLTVRIKPPNGAWIVAGAEDQSGYVPEGVSATATEWGSDTISFNLRRDPRIPFPDLQPFSPCELEVGGVVVWSGYVWQTPASGPHTIGIAGRGWQYHLDDDQAQRLYAHARMGDWIDSRSGYSAPTIDLTGYTAGWQITEDEGAKVLAWPKGVAMGAGQRAAITLDGGYAGAIKRLAIIYTNNAWTDPTLLRADVGDTLPITTGSSNTLIDNLGTAHTSTVAGVTFATARRYCQIRTVPIGAAVTPAADNYLRFEAIRAFSSTAYESGGASLLLASWVIADALALAPLLDQGVAQIGQTTFAIPELAPQGYQTPRALMQAANAFHDWLIQVTPERRLVYRARPTLPMFAVGPGARFQDAALNSGEDVYNRVVVQARGESGTQLNVLRTASSPLLAGQGRSRTFVLAVNAMLSQAAAEQMGDAWLVSRTRTPAKGSLTIASPDDLLTLSSGARTHPSLLLRATGERIRMMDRVNPENGSWGRDGTIASVSYDHGSESASISIDSPRDRLESLLAKFGALQTAAGL